MVLILLSEYSSKF